jgi:hypothetical protein
MSRNGVEGMRKRIRHFIVKVCIVCGCELSRYQQKYCATHAQSNPIQIAQWRKAAWTKGHTDQQLMHWHGVKV